jgi:hypothetical protein
MRMMPFIADKHTCSNQHGAENNLLTTLNALCHIQLFTLLRICIVTSWRLYELFTIFGAMFNRVRSRAHELETFYT